MNRYLDMVDGPAHVKKLTPPQLEQLAGEIRQELITGLAKAGTAYFERLIPRKYRTGRPFV